MPKAPTRALTAVALTTALLAAGNARAYIHSELATIPETSCDPASTSEPTSRSIMFTPSLAAHNLEAIDEIRLARGGLWTIREKARLIIALARLGLEGLASPNAVERCDRTLG